MLNPTVNTIHKQFVTELNIAYKVASAIGSFVRMCEKFFDKPNFARFSPLK